MSVTASSRGSHKLRRRSDTPMNRFVIATAVWMALATSASAQQPVPPTNDRVILITLDGARTEEIFGGLDVDVLRSTLAPQTPVESHPSYRRYWAPTREERRQRLLPFFWSLLTQHGSIAGDPALLSSVRLTNRHWFSYPGYSEILLGQAHDDVIKSNDPLRNPFPTVLEEVRTRLGLHRDEVATFGSWGVFNAIAEHTEGATHIDAGVEPLEATDAEGRLLAMLQAQTTTPWDGTRFDAYTFRLAMRHLATARPRFLYLAFDETDDWAHDGRYDRVLDTYARTDAYLRELWTWLQAQPDYRDRTHLLITTDHGRGHTPKDWRNHGATTVGSDAVWIALVSPRDNRRGPWKDHPPLFTNQVAATLARWFGLDWRATHPDAGPPLP